MVKEKRHIGKYKRTRLGKEELVRDHDKFVNLKPELSKEMKKEITKGKARTLFNKRSSRSKQMDMFKQARKMFATPNAYWADNINSCDMWGIDGFQPPIISFNPLKIKGLPFQIVEFKKKIYLADKSGKFSLQKLEQKKPIKKKKKEEEIKSLKKSKESTKEKPKEEKELEPLKKPEKPEKIKRPKKTPKLDPLNEELQKQFKEDLGKNAIWHDKPTKSYEQWLKKEAKLQEIASQLNYTKANKEYTLKDIKQYYEKIKIDDKELKKAMFKLYKQVQKDQPKSMDTKKFKAFYENKYYNKIDALIKTEENRIKLLNQDPKNIKQGKINHINQAKKGRGLPYLNVKSMLKGDGYGTLISAFSIVDGMKSYNYTKDTDTKELARNIADRLIANFKANDDPDSDMPDVQAMDKLDQKYHDEMKEHWKTGVDEQYLDYLISKGYSDEKIQRKIKTHEQKQEKLEKQTQIEHESFMSKIQDFSLAEIF